MAKRHPDMVHHFDRESGRILCGIDDPHAHWTTRRSVSCTACDAVLREREHERRSGHHAPSEAHGATA